MKLAACALVLAIAPAAQGKVEVWSPFPEAAVLAFVRELGAADVTVTTVSERGLGDRVREAVAQQRLVVLLGHDAFALGDTAQRGLCAGAPEYSWCDPWLMIAGVRESDSGTEPEGMDDLAFDGARHAEYVVPAAEVADALWTGWIADLMRSGRTEDFAFTWLRTLEAHALETPATEEAVVSAVRSGRARFGVVAGTAWLRSVRAEGRGPLRTLELRTALPVRAHGLALATGAEANATAKALVARLLDQKGRAEFAVRFGLEPAPKDVTARIPALHDAERWMNRWLLEEKGKGKLALSVDGWVDIASCGVFAAFLVYAWRRLGRAEQKNHV